MRKALASKRNWIAVLIAGLVVAAVSSFQQPQQTGRETGMPAASLQMPAVAQLTHSGEDHDYPAIAQSGDNIYVTYVQFLHADRALEARNRFTQAPQNFDFLSRPAGGDQVFLLTYSKSKRTWSAPVAVSAPKQDILRAAVATDRQGRVWVFWAANKSDNFDIYAKSLRAGKWSQEIRLTTDSGTDINPVATTDSNGRVWVSNTYLFLSSYWFG